MWEDLVGSFWCRWDPVRPVCGSAWSSRLRVELLLLLTERSQARRSGPPGGNPEEDQDDVPLLGFMEQPDQEAGGTWVSLAADPVTCDP